MSMEQESRAGKNQVSAVRTKLTKLAHDSKATVWSKIGPRLKRTKAHPHILDRIVVQESSSTICENELEGELYGCRVQTRFSHPKRYLYVLKDIWVTGSEGHVLFELNKLFSVCSSFDGSDPKKIRRPIKWLARRIEEPVFILSSRAPGNRGHFLTEHLPRLVASWKTLAGFGKFKILVTPGHRPWQVEYLEKLGIQASDVVEASFGSVFCAKAYFVPVLCEGQRATISVESDYRFIRKQFLAGRKPSGKGSPVFLSRADAPDRRLINEDSVFEVAQKFFPDMKRFTLSKLSLDEQVGLFQEARVVMGPHSQSFRNVLFCNKSIVIQLLQGFREPGNEYYHWAKNYSCMGLMNENQCVSLFSEIPFHKNSDWMYPPEKLERDLNRLVNLLGA